MDKMNRIPLQARRLDCISKQLDMQPRPCTWKCLDEVFIFHPLSQMLEPCTLLLPQAAERGVRWGHHLCVKEAPSLAG